MSYGIGIVIPKEDLTKDIIRYEFCDWTLGIAVKMYPEDCKRNFIKWSKEFIDCKNLTTVNKLETAPCDIV